MRAGAKRALLTGILHNLWLPGALVAGKETPRYGTTIWLGAERLSLYSDTLPPSCCTQNFGLLSTSAGSKYLYLY